MRNIIIEIKDKTKEEHFINFLKQIPFISIRKQEKTVKKKNTEFKKLFGIWNAKSIDINDIRRKAWSRK